MSSFNNPFSQSQNNRTIGELDENHMRDGGRRKYSISEVLAQSVSSQGGTFEFGGRSYVGGNTGMTNRASMNTMFSPAVHSGILIHEQTANLASIGVTDDAEDSKMGNKNSFAENLVSEVMSSENEGDYMSSSPPIPILGSTPGNARQFLGRIYNEPEGATDVEPLLINTSKKLYTDEYASSANNVEPNDLEIGDISYKPVGEQELTQEPSKLHKLVIQPLNYIPAVFLGTLLNILDGLSYGMIMFPISESIFASLAPAGLSMFYVSCIVSQLIFSLGGSAFRAGIGSEMIEVTPFFHVMALSILEQIGSPEENKDAIISTTIVTYAILSILTGLVFFLLGKLKLGSLVGFFPRHILVGCIGGVGYFLVVTGIEVSSRLEGGIYYNAPTFFFLFNNYITLLEWVIPLILALILIVMQTKFHNSLLVPLFFIGVFVMFHFLVFAIPGWSLDSARQYGWVFPEVEANEPWYSFYDLYDFSLVHWWCIAKQVPTMLALTFFGILHIPINVPALAATIKMDQIDVDRELVAHGYSNVLSGLLGSIQNYLVYTNSVLFIRAGADARLAGVLLAIATGAVMVVGPVLIGYIPVCVVGALIYLLGYELLKEALYDTWGKLRRLEYSTILIIVVVMGAWDFVYGVLAGILLACLLFVIEAARRPVVRGIYTGVVARSTVLRHPKQQEFLKDVGDQICVLKLQGTVFFGSIGGVEDVIRLRLEDDKFKENPIKFLILDMKGVDSVDFSAAEGFRRMLNLSNEYDVQLIISSVTDEDDIVKALRDAGLWDTENNLDIQLFSTLNYALEWCENCFLSTYKLIRRKQKHTPISKAIGTNFNSIGSMGTPDTDKLLSNHSMDMKYATPRTTQVYKAAERTVNYEQGIQNRLSVTNDSLRRKPLPLIMITFAGLSEKNDKFWSKLTPYFIKEQIPEDYTFYDTSKDRPAFFIVESGLIRSVCKFESDGRELRSSILPMTAFGDLYDKGSNYRDMVYTTVNDTLTWKLSESKLNELLKTPDGYAVYNELLKIQAKLVRERFDTMTANLVISA